MTDTPDHRAVIAMIEERMQKGRRVYGPLDLATDERDFVQEAVEEALDMAVYLGAKLIQMKNGDVPDYEPDHTDEAWHDLRAAADADAVRESAGREMRRAATASEDAASIARVSEGDDWKGVQDAWDDVFSKALNLASLAAQRKQAMAHVEGYIRELRFNLNLEGRLAVELHEAREVAKFRQANVEHCLDRGGDG